MRTFLNYFVKSEGSSTEDAISYTTELRKRSAILILKIPREKEMRMENLFAMGLREQKPLRKGRVN